MPLQPPGARAQSELFALDSACGAVVLASTSGATATPQPTGSTSASSPVASSLDGPSATQNRPGPRCRQAAYGPYPRCLFFIGSPLLSSNVSIALSSARNCSSTSFDVWRIESASRQGCRMRDKLDRP